jgi:hypothetical protein
VSALTVTEMVLVWFSKLLGWKVTEPEAAL